MRKLKSLLKRQLGHSRKTRRDLSSEKTRNLFKKLHQKWPHQLRKRQLLQRPRRSQICRQKQKCLIKQAKALLLSRKRMHQPQKPRKEVRPKLRQHLLWKKIKRSKQPNLMMKSQHQVKTSRIWLQSPHRKRRRKSLQRQPNQSRQIKFPRWKTLSQLPSRHPKLLNQAQLQLKHHQPKKLRIRRKVLLPNKSKRLKISWQRLLSHSPQPKLVRYLLECLLTYFVMRSFHI